MPASSHVSLVGGETSVRKRVLAFACAPPGRPGVGTHARLLRTRSWSRYGASELRVGENSYAVPSTTGVHLFMIMPFGMYITPRRLIGFAGVLPRADNAGTIASNTGNASIAPRPRNTVRRETTLFVISIV